MGKRGIEEFAQPNASYPINIGNIVIPNDVERDDFINTCFRRERVSVNIWKGGGLINDCYISKELLMYIDFPEDSTETGTPVMLAFPKNITQPVIIAALSDEKDTQLLKDGIYRIGKSVNENVSFITCDGNNGSILLNTSGNGITLTASNEDSKILLQSLGSTVIKSTKNLSISVNDNINIKSMDFGNESETIFNLTPENFQIKDNSSNEIKSDGENIEILPKTKLVLFGGSEPLVKGNELQTQLNQTNTYLTQLQTAISSALVILDGLGVPASTTFNSAMTGATKGNFSNINSKKSFTD